MSPSVLEPERDLVIERVIHAPRSAVWQAWTQPRLLEQWWVPAPYRARVEHLDVRPGGAFVTSLSPDGADFEPHMDATFLVVEPEQRLVFTNAITSTWHPVSPAPVAITVDITLTDVPEGTGYRAVVRHQDAAAAARHVELGFYEGWTATAAGLAEVAEAFPS